MKRLLLLFLLMFILLILPLNVASLTWHNCCDSITINEEAIRAGYQKHKELNEYPRQESEFKTVAVYNNLKRCQEKEDKLEEIFNAFIGKIPSITLQQNGKYLATGGVGLAGADVSQMPIHDFSIDSWYRENAVPFRYQKTTLDYKSGSWILNGGLNVFEPRNSHFAYMLPNENFNSFKQKYEELVQEAEKICKGQDMYFTCVNTYVLSDDTISKNIGTFTWAGKTYIEGLLNCENFMGGAIDEGFASITSNQQEENINCAQGQKISINDAGAQICLDEAEQEIEKIKLDLNKQTLLLDGKDTIKATFTFLTKDESGKEVPYTNRNVWGFGVDTQEPGLEFDITPVKGITNQKGEFVATISLKNAKRNIMEERNNSRVYVYSTKMPLNQREETYFTLAYAKSIQITNVEVIGKVAWQQRGTKLKITVEDPLNERKRYTIDSSSRIKLPEGQEIESTNGIRAGGKTSEYIGYVTTVKNEVEVGWYAPTLTREEQISYGKKIAKSLANAGLMWASSKGTDKAKDYKKSVEETKEAVTKNIPSEIARLRNEGRFNFILNDNEYEKFLGYERLYENMNKFVGFDSLASKDSKDLGKRVGITLTEDSQPVYSKINTALKGLFWAEGAVGIARPDKSIPPGVKIPLQLLMDWYDTVEEMENFAKEDKMSITVPVTIIVEGIESGASDTRTIDIPVEGYKVILTEEKIW